MTRRGVRPLSLLVLAAVGVVACAAAFFAHNVIRDQNRRLLRERAGEVGALLTNSSSGVAATLRSLSTVVHEGDSSPQAFVDSATPLVVGQTRAILLVRVSGSELTRVTMVGDGVPEGTITGDRASLMQRAAHEPGLVSGLISDGLRHRIGLALGPGVGRDGWIVYQESAIDPYYPDPTKAGAPFSELDVALYASTTPSEDKLVLATTRQVPVAGESATSTVPVGVDSWLVVVGTSRPLVGSLATRIPLILLGGGIVAALLAATVVEVLSRRRDFALALVDDRTASLRTTVADLEEAQRELVLQALHDELTHLPNRTLFINRLEHALERAGREQTLTAVMFIDLDRFKWVNDSLGHDAGDQMLGAVAGRLAHTVRPGDTVARLGGDEFVILCEGLSTAKEAHDLAARLRQALLPAFVFDGRDVRLTMSIGLAIAGGDAGDETAETLVRDADLAMYRAKELGRDRVELFDNQLRQHAAAKFETETALRRAVSQREFVVHYQPLVDLKQRKVVGVEALVRWNDPERGLLSPDKFIPIAEDTGLIGPVGNIVLTDACRQVAEWNQDRGELDQLTVSVNLSARQLDLTELAESVTEALTVTGLDPVLLWLEITETTLMKDAPSTLEALYALKALGVTLVVDDFGTGYSSLLYLRRFPVDVLKVDQSFVAGLGDSAEDTAIVVGVVRLAQALGLSAVAEGVETPEQLEQLALLGCELAQGFFWSPPLSADDFEAWLGSFDAASNPGTDGVDSRPAIRVLLVDDQPAVRDLIRLTMLLEGCFDVIAEASNGADAIELAGTHQPDLVVLDLLMPVLDGAEALPRIAAAAPNATIVVLTAVEPSALDIKSLTGAARYFDKTADLSATVASLPTLVGAVSTS
ncbi:MAG: hypothetical protein QOJ67_884 [Acidimicrobiaceae bacterium]